MKRMRRCRFVFSAAIAFSICIQAFTVSATAGFASLTFSQQWHEGETGIPNFWGPLATAHEGQREGYKEAPGGQRLVQYFDKTRMELTNPATGMVTNGLLTVELVTGQMQTGDAIFESRDPAKINVAGDPGSAGVTYTDLAHAPKFASPGATGNGSPYPWAYDNGTFNPRGDFQYKRDGDHFVSTTPDGPFYPFDAPASAHSVRVEGGPYGHYVYGTFARFLQSFATSADLAATVLQTVGYPITPFFFARTTIKGTAQWVIVQAFERRVLTMTADGLVEFGNIGQHYYQWRYGNTSTSPATTPVAGGAPVTAVQVDTQHFAKRWAHHGYQLVVGPDGYARSDERSYTPCDSRGTDPAIPCEDPVTSSSIHAIIRFTSVNGDVASGKVLRSNYPGRYPTNATVTLTLKPYGMAEFTLRSNKSLPLLGADNTLTLCGPDYTKLAPPDLLRQSLCGA